MYIYLVQKHVNNPHITILGKTHTILLKITSLLRDINIDTF